MTQARYQGVLSVADIKDRCYVDAATGHWHWRACMTGRSDGYRAPYVWYPPIRQSVTIAKAIGLIKTGQTPPEGKVWYRACECWDFANPDHFKLGTWSEKSKKARPANTALHNAKISAAMLAKIGSQKKAGIQGNSIFNLT